MIERWTHSERPFIGRIFSLRTGEVRLEDGTVASREMVEHPGGVGILPVLQDGVVLVDQYRVAIEDHVLEIPAGKLEGAEDPAQRAAAELAEEAGYRAGRLEWIGDIYASVGYTSEKVHLFLAYDLEDVGQQCEFDERIELVHVPFANIAPRLAANEIQDAKTVIALHALLARCKGLENGGTALR